MRIPEVTAFIASLILSGLLIGCPAPDNPPVPFPGYLAGARRDGTNHSIPGYWLNGTWTPVSLPAADMDGYVYGIVVSGGAIHAAGYTQAASGTMVPAYWLNGAHTPLPVIDGTKHSLARAVALSGTDVYVVGSSTNGANVSVPVYWINGALNTDLPVLDSGHDGAANALCISGSDVLIAGYTTTAADLMVPAYWLNKARTDLNPPVAWAGRPGAAVGITGSASRVIVAGYCENGNFAPGSLPDGSVLLWDNGAVSELSQLGTATGVSEAGSHVYVAGCVFSSGGSGTIPAHWADGTQTVLPAIDATRLARTYGVVAAGGNVFAYGSARNTDNVNIPVYWCNGRRTALVPESSSTGGLIYAACLP